MLFFLISKNLIGNEFAGDALQALHDAGVGEVWSTDCIPHPSNAVAMAGPLAAALRSVLAA